MNPSNPHGCCDQRKYLLTLHLRLANGEEKVFSTYWFGETSSQVPAILHQLFDSAFQAQTPC